MTEREYYHIRRELWKIKTRIEEICLDLRLTQDGCLDIPGKVTIFQIDDKGEKQMITGIQKGAPSPSVFEADPNTPYPSGTILTWKADDPAVVLTPSTSNPLQVSASVPGSDPLPQFNLSVSAKFPSGSPDLPATVNVPLLGGSVGTLPTSIAINQIS